MTNTATNSYTAGDIQLDWSWIPSTTATTWTYACGCCNKSAREQVQDEILAKIAQAIATNNLKKAKELLELAKKLKEL